jgi:N-carbamoylputrescine amidase
MRAALAVHRVVADPATNLVTIERAAQAAADAGAELVVFSETALTGFVANDDPAHDRPLARPVPGPATERLAALARDRGLWIALGLYERAEEGGQECLYDAAVLLGPDGAIHLHYRRITPQWHWPNADPRIYRQGTGLPMATTPFGTCVFLLCGDLFDETVLNRLRQLRPDWLLFPFARRFDSEVADAAQWEQAERLDYARQAGRAGVAALMVNYLADSPATGGCFGGALVVTRDGTIFSSLPPGREGLLLVDLAGVP